MVARAVTSYCTAQGDQVRAFGREELNIADSSVIADKFNHERPEAVINCAAWTDVDGCEADRAKAYEINARGPELLAAGCRQIGASLITISTDYVFDGAKDGFYTQRDDPNPQSVYGKAKLEGERLAQSANARTIVVRTGWIFGPGGRNFLSQVITRAQSGARLMAISDAYGTPTYALDLAKRLRELAEIDLPGIYHIVNSGAGASFAEFTRAALDTGGYPDLELENVLMDSLTRPAPRPRNSRLRCLLSEAIGLEPMPDWRSALLDFVSTAQKAL